MGGTFSDLNFSKGFILPFLSIYSLAGHKILSQNIIASEF